MWFLWSVLQFIRCTKDEASLGTPGQFIVCYRISEGCIGNSISSETSVTELLVTREGG